MKVSQWLRNQAAALMLSFTNVQIDSLAQNNKNEVKGGTNSDKKQTATNLMQALKNGEVTKEVRDTRWRMYKVAQASKGYNIKVTGYEEKIINDNGKIEKIKCPIFETINSVLSHQLSKVRVDKTDWYPVQMIINNEKITMGANDVFDSLNDNNDIINISDSISYHSLVKGISPIIVARENVSQFSIEDFTKRVVIKSITETKKLIEFYVSKYPIVEYKNSKLFLNEVNKIINGKRSDIVNLTELGFVTYNVLGAADYLEYQYTLDNFLKITEFEGTYVFKYEATVIVNGLNVIEQYLENDLEEKYNNKEARKHTI